MLHKDEKISQMLDVALNDEYLHNTSQTCYINTKKSFQKGIQLWGFAAHVEDV